MIAEVERITGGRAEIGTFHVVPFHLQVEVRNITVHGKEAATDVPLAHADSLVAQLKVISFLRTEFGFRDLTLEHPVVHIAIGPDGTTTNVPALKVTLLCRSTCASNSCSRCRSIILSVRNGELLWADQKIPLDFSVHDTDLQHGLFVSARPV